MKIRETSVTDNEVYPSFCLNAAIHDDIFERFRRDNIYTGIVETLGRYQDGLVQLNEILKNESIDFSDSDWNNFMRNELYGSPVKYRYDIKNSKYEFAPTTLRYIKILQDILGLIGTKKIKRMIEIGGGYGGQARILLDYMDIGEYILVDLPETLKLADRYLSQYDILSAINFMDGTKEIESQESDLIISNYAFSELKRNVQEKYIQKFFRNAKKGYIRWNDISHRMFGGYSLEEMMHIFPEARIISEEPKTSANNCIIIW